MKKDKKPFYPFGFAFTVHSLNQPVYDQVIRTMKFRDFFSPRFVLATIAIKDFQRQGAFNGLGHYKVVVRSRKEYDMYKLPKEETDA